MASTSDKHAPAEHEPADHPDKMPMGQEHAPHTASQTLADHQAVGHYSPPFTATEHSAAHAPHHAALAPHHEASLPQESAPDSTPAPATSTSPTPATGGTPEPPIPFDASAPGIWQAKAHPTHTGLDGGVPADAMSQSGNGQSALDQLQGQIGVDNSPSFTSPPPKSPEGPGSSDSHTTPAHKPTLSTEHGQDLQPGAGDAFPLQGPSTGTLPGTDFGDPHLGGTGHHTGDGTPHGHLPGTDFGGQSAGDLPDTDLALGPHHPGSGPGMDHAFDHHADMGPPPAIA
ncbi:MULTISPECIES: hypothetical protein [unclassified Nonomuraea]|uniref:hypothetical protein n=1 Tax=unclassified Nonomuraea TaxID=2593643 RepID=UPI0033FFBD3A